MLTLSLPTRFQTRLEACLLALRGETCSCFHCGETMRLKNALMLEVAGKPQAMCCHGCYAVMQTVIRDGLLEEYLAAKSTSQVR